MNDPADAPWGSVDTHFAPIHSAARLRDVAAIQAELAAGVDVDVENGRAANGDGGNTALWFAAQGAPTGGLEVAKVLLAAGANVNRACEHGRTALHMAACWGHLDVVRLLVENGADKRLRDEQNFTAAMLAENSNRVASDRLQAVVKYLSREDVS